MRWSETGGDRTDWPTLDVVRAAMGALATPLREVMTLLARQAADLAAMDKDVRYLLGGAIPSRPSPPRRRHRAPLEALNGR